MNIEKRKLISLGGEHAKPIDKLKVVSYVISIAWIVVSAVLLIIFACKSVEDTEEIIQHDVIKTESVFDKPYTQYIVEESKTEQQDTEEITNDILVELLYIKQQQRDLIAQKKKAQKRKLEQVQIQETAKPVPTVTKTINELTIVSGKPRNYTAEVDVSAFEYVGNFTITGYDTCVECCGKNDGITASGIVGIPGYSVAAGNVYPYGTILYISGYGFYEVHDRGGAIGQSNIDILVNNHEEAYSVTAENVPVYVVSWGG